MTTVRSRRLPVDHPFYAERRVAIELLSGDRVFGRTTGSSATTISLRPSRHSKHAGRTVRIPRSDIAYIVDQG